MNVRFLPKVEEDLVSLIDILYQKGYFGFKAEETCSQYL